MCGIAGIKSKLENRDIALRKMLESMRLRGPDSEGEYYDNEVAFGHRRLKIIDLSAQGDQPIVNEGSNTWIVTNGEIYNFRELRSQLEGLGHRFRSQTDSEVILHGYEQWGIACLDELRGMFAFCIWDKLNKKLFLARDRLGIKPLYYYFKDDLFVFASSVRAILATRLVPKRLALAGLATYLDCGGLKEPLTIIQGIYSLLPGQYITLTEEGFKITQYWEPKALSKAMVYSRPEEIRERINGLLKESVKLHLASDVPLGIFLSGGIDSSSLLTFMAKMVTGIKSVSLVFKEQDLSEARYSRMMAERYNTQHQEINIEQDFLLKNINTVITSMDEPTFNGINTYFVSWVAKEAGLKVALSGLGGDEVFCGYSTFKRIARLIWFCRFWNMTPGVSTRISAAILKSIIPAIPQKEKILELIKNGSSLRHPYFWLRRLFSEEQSRHLLKVFPFFPEDKTAGIEDLDIINQVSYLEICNYMRDILLRDTDCMSMAHSLEVRVPFLDHKLIEFMFSIPGELKMDSRLNKPLLINSLDEPLPEVIIRRKKMGFTLPFEHWLGQDLKPEIEDTLSEKDAVLDEFINQESVLGIWREFLKGHITWQRPWAIYVLKKWVKIYLQ